VTACNAARTTETNLTVIILLQCEVDRRWRVVRSVMTYVTLLIVRMSRSAMVLSMECIVRGSGAPLLFSKTSTFPLLIFVTIIPIVKMEKMRQTVQSLRKQKACVGNPLA
jgi:hypothetical protein